MSFQDEDEEEKTKNILVSLITLWLVESVAGWLSWVVCTQDSIYMAALHTLLVWIRIIGSFMLATWGDWKMVFLASTNLTSKTIGIFCSSIILSYTTASLDSRCSILTCWDIRFGFTPKVLVHPSVCVGLRLCTLRRPSAYWLFADPWKPGTTISKIWNELEYVKAQFRHV